MPSSDAPRLPLALAVFCGLLALVMLAFAGRTFSIDEQSVMATADSLARFGRADTNLLAYTHWDLPPPAGLGRFGPDGEYYSKKAPGLALLIAPLFWLGLRLPWLGSQPAALLAAPLLTALTAALVFDLGCRLGYRAATALAAAGLLALASPALAYSRSLFTEPLAMAGLALALHGAYPGRGAAARPLLCGLGLAVAIAANAVYVAVVPLFLAFFAFPFDWRTVRRWALACLPPALWLAGVAAFNLARFGSLFESGYHFDGGEGFTAPFWLGAYGLLFSPARGLAWFFPLSLLAIPGWASLRARARPLAWLALALFAWHVAIFSPWWSWAGGVSWGPRFLLPALPAVALCLLPIVEAGGEGRRWPWGLAVGALAGASLAVQVVGAGVDINQVEAELSAVSPWTPGAPPGFNHGWDALTRPALSPIIVGWRLLAEAPLEIAWLQGGEADWPALLLLLSAAVAAGALLARWLAQPPARSRALAGAGLLCLWTAIVLNLALARLPRQPLGLYGPLSDLPPTLAGTLPGDVLISLAPDLTWAMLDVGTRAPVYGLPRAVGPDDAQAQAAFGAALARARRAWLLTYDPPPDDWYGAALAGRGDLIYDEALDGYRLRVFALR